MPAMTRWAVPWGSIAGFVIPLAEPQQGSWKACDLRES